jgi:hypothetical protein
MALRQPVLPPPTSTTNQGLTTTTPYSTAVKRDMKSHEFYRRKKLEFFNNAFVSAFRLMSLPFTDSTECYRHCGFCKRDKKKRYMQITNTNKKSFCFAYPSMIRKMCRREKENKRGSPMISIFRHFALLPLSSPLLCKLMLVEKAPL